MNRKPDSRPDAERDFSARPEEERRRQIEGLTGRPGVEDEEGQGQGQGQVLELLQAGIGDSSWRVRKAAVEVFLSLPDSEERRRFLEEALRSEDNAGRRNSAIEIFTRLGNKVLPQIKELVADRDPDVRKFAIEILGELQGEEVEDLLVSCLQDSDANARMAAVEELGKVGSPRAVDPLVRCFDRSIPGLDFLILQTLGEIGSRGATLPVEPLVERVKDPSLRKAAVAALGAGRNLKALPVLIAEVREGSLRQREKALVALARLVQGQLGLDLTGKGINLDEIVPFLESGKKRIRLAAIQVLSRVKSSGVLEALLPRFLTGEEEEQTGARSGIVQRGREALESLIQKYRAIPGERRPRVLELLGILDSRGEARLEAQRKNLIREILSSPASGREEQAEAAAAAGRLGMIEAAGALVRFLGEEDMDLAAAAMSALRMLAEKNRDRVVKEALARMRDGSSRLQRNLVILLGEIRAESAAKELILALKSGSPEVREEAAVALAEAGVKEAEEDLILCLADEDARVRAKAAQALGQMGGEKAVEPLKHALSDEDLWVRAAVAEALGRIGKKAPGVVEALSQAAAAGEGPVAVAAVRALAQMGEEETQAALVKALGASDPEVVAEALESLAPLAEGQVPLEVILNLLSHSSFTVRLRMVKALQGMVERGEKQISSALQERLEIEDDPLVREAVLALLRAGKKEG